MKKTFNFKVLFFLIASLGLPGIAQAVSLLEVALFWAPITM